MSFRMSALAAVAVLGLGSVTPASAQPQAPIRPRSSTFGSIFTPGLQQQQQQQQLMLNQALGGVGPGVGVGGFGNQGLLGGGGFGYPGMAAYPQAFPGAFGVTSPQLPASGIVGSFGNYGHWYSQRGGGNYGHWYPNGIASGRGVLSNASSGSGGGFTGGLGRSGSTLGTLGGTALGIGATMNQFRR